MRNVLRLTCLSFIVFFVFISCQKETVEPVESVKEKSFLSSAENRAAIVKSLKAYVDENSSSIASANGSGNGAKFIAPVIIGSGQGIFEFDPETLDFKIASYTAFVGEKDFFRENPDGTITMHLSSKNALAEYMEGNFMEFEPSKYLYGENAHLTVNLTGTVFEFEIFPGFVIRFLEPDNSKATVFQGNGKVGENGGAPWQLLTVKMLTTSTGMNIYQYKLGDIMFKNKSTF
jgi:hypothetical protein